MGEQYFEDVTDRAVGEAPFGVVVAALEERGWRVLGRVAQRSVPGSRLAWDRHERERVAVWAARPPGTLLASGDRTAYALVDAYGEAPLVRLRTLLTDGSVVETVAVASHGLLRQRRLDPYVGFTLADAEGRSVTLLRDTPAPTAVEAHAAAVAAQSAARGAEPVEHADRRPAVDLWNDLSGHAVLAARALARRTRLVSVVLVAAAVAVMLVVSSAVSRALGLDAGWDLVVHLAVAGAVLGVLFPVMQWAGRRLRETRGWRPPYA